MDTSSLRDSYNVLLETAAAIADNAVAPPVGWNAEQILAHVSLITAETIRAAASVAAGTDTTYENRVAQDTWTIGRTIERAGGGAGLRERISGQADALCAVTSALSEPELDTAVPTLLLSNGDLMFDGQLSLRDIVTGLAAAEIPGHTKQLSELVTN